MNKTICQKGTWTLIATNVQSFSFNLTNTYPDKSQKCGYKIHWGLVEPAVDTTLFNYYGLDNNNQIVYAYPIEFSNSVAQNIYVMSVFDDGAVTY